MDAKRWSKLQVTFDQLADMQPYDQERELREIQANDSVLATEVRELLEEDAAGRELPELNVENLLDDAMRGEKAELPTEGQIGPYRIIRLLGEGGMGVVYLAERTDIARPVAIKLLRDAWLSPVRRQRFGAEQQMLGLLKHPAIARIYDAGTTKEGTPWFVMEYSDGVPITDYLLNEDQRGHSLTAREIVKLVASVCETVRYAHSLAIIHRDLKPSNILVAGDGQIKLLDFGIAKQMEMVNQGSSVTTFGLRLFTPAYAAPELQTENRVGVFTDVYSMGVILYQLLTGVLPFSEGTTGDRLPQRLSRKVSSTVSNHLALNKSEWTDIDAICLKALDHAPENRYLSMDALIDDLNAFLEYRPITIRKNAFVYTTGKFLRRNRVSVLSVTTGLLLVMAATVMFTVRLARARDAAGKARDEAVAQAARSARLESFTESLFTGGQSFGVPPPGIKVTKMLDRGRSEALQMTGDELLQAEMFQTLGTAYLNLGHSTDAEPLLRRAQKVICASGAALQCALIEERLGWAISSHGPFTESRALMKDALRIQEEKLRADDPRITHTMTNLATLDRNSGDWVESKVMYDDALARVSASGRSTPALAATLSVYAVGAVPYGDPRAIQYEEQSARINSRLYGENSFEHALNEWGLGSVYFGDGKYQQSEQHFRTAVAEARAWTGANTSITTGYIGDLAGTLVLEGKFSEAKVLLKRDIVISEKVEPGSTFNEGQAYFYLGFVELQQGELKAAEDHFEQVIAMGRRHAAVSPLFVEYSELGLAHVYSKRGGQQQAEALIREVLATTKLKPSYVMVAGYALLGHVLLQEGRLADAEAALKPAYTWFSHDATRPHTAMAYKDYAEVEKRLGRPQEAATILAALRSRPR